MTTSQRTRIEARLAKGRSLSEAERAAAWRSVLVDRVANSMAMEGEPVSDQWIKQAKTKAA
jgi:predicted flap endonuclease-1-like 5' DNA nuclease